MKCIEDAWNLDCCLCLTATATYTAWSGVWTLICLREFFALLFRCCQTLIAIPRDSRNCHAVPLIRDNTRLFKQYEVNQETKCASRL